MNNRGFTLIQTLVSLGIMSISILALMEALASRYEAERYFKNVQIIEDSLAMAKMLLNQSEVCKGSFAATKITRVGQNRDVPFDLKSWDGTTLGTTIMALDQEVSPGLVIKSARLKVTGMLGSTRFLGALYLGFQATQPGTLVALSRTLSLAFDVDGSGVITRCGTVEAMNRRPGGTGTIIAESPNEMVTEDQALAIKEAADAGATLNAWCLSENANHGLETRLYTEHWAPYLCKPSGSNNCFITFGKLTGNPIYFSDKSISGIRTAGVMNRAGCNRGWKVIAE